MEYKVTLQQWLSSNCPYQGCKYNNFGCCEYDDEDFIGEIEELIHNEDIDRNKEIIPCKPTIPEDVCPYCGEELNTWYDTVEMWGAKISMSTRYCRNGC